VQLQKRLPNLAHYEFHSIRINQARAKRFACGGGGGGGGGGDVCMCVSSKWFLQLDVRIWDDKVICVSVSDEAGKTIVSLLNKWLSIC
jgi:hypothetical protein